MSNIFPILDKQIIHVNSRDKLRGTDSDFTIELPIQQQVAWSHVSVLDIAIPKSYYLVPSNRRTFVLDENGTEYQIVLTAGNYTRTSLRLAIETALNDAGSYTYSISNPSINTAVDTGKYTFTVSGNGGIQPILIFTDSLWEQLGFDKDSSNAFSGDSLTSTNVCNLNAEQTVFLRSDICQNYSNNILQEVFAGQVQSFSFIDWINPDPLEYAKRFSGGASNLYRFFLTDEDENDLDLNGLNIQFTLMLFRVDQTMALIRRYIKYLTLAETLREAETAALSEAVAEASPDIPE